MVPLFQCQLCRSKILEINLQKHHAKVHSGVDYDIYTPLTTNDAPPVANTQASINWFNNNPPPAATDEEMVHVSCNICGNKMPAVSLKQHMKRKHIDAGDQVDAVGAMVNSMSFDVHETSEKAKVVATATNPSKQSQGSTVAEMTTSWPKVKNPFSTSFRFTATPKIDASTTTDEDSPFYTIRVSVDQMKQLMSENRIHPKDGYFYLK